MAQKMQDNLETQKVVLSDLIDKNRSEYQDKGGVQNNKEDR